jgi:hypothetical protein
MAKDADGNHYYDAGTIAEQFEKWEVYEDEDGNVGFYNGTAELRLHEAGHVFGAKRGEPGTSELAQGEAMLFVSDGSGPNTDGDFVIAYNDGGTVKGNVLDSLTTE